MDNLEPTVVAMPERVEGYWTCYGRSEDVLILAVRTWPTPEREFQYREADVLIWSMAVDGPVVDWVPYDEVALTEAQRDCLEQVTGEGQP